VDRRDGETGRTDEWEADNNGGLRGRCIDWLPLVQISSWPGAASPNAQEAEDTFAVRFLMTRSRRRRTLGTY